MMYEQALELLGNAPAWVLKDIIERQPRSRRHAAAARLLLRVKQSGI